MSDEDGGERMYAQYIDGSRFRDQASRARITEHFYFLLFACTAEKCSARAVASCNRIMPSQIAIFSDAILK